MQGLYRTLQSVIWNDLNLLINSTFFVILSVNEESPNFESRQQTGLFHSLQLASIYRRMTSVSV